MRRFLRFLFNLLRNLSFAFCLLLAGLIAWAHFFPESLADAVVSQRHLFDDRLDELSDDPYANTYSVQADAEADSNIEFTPGQGKRVVIKSGERRLFFELDEFVFAKPGKKNYVKIYLRDKVNMELRLSLTMLKSKLKELDLQVYAQKDYVVNPMYVRSIERTSSGSLWRLKLDAYPGERILLPEKKATAAREYIEQVIINR